MRTPINALRRTDSMNVFSVNLYPAHNKFKIIVNFLIVMGGVADIFISFV